MQLPKRRAAARAMPNVVAGARAIMPSVAAEAAIMPAVIAAAAAKAFWDLYRQGGIPPDMRVAFFVGIIASGIIGCAVIALLMRYLRTHTLKFFVYYRLIFGIMVIALATIFRQNAG